MDKTVNYSSSSESDTPEPPPPKKLKKLPVPFETVKAIKIEDPLLHGGRKRQVEHVEGNWASHIFIEPEEDFIEKFKNFFEDIQRKHEGINIINSPHVSLSKMFILKHHWIDNFFKVFTKNLKFREFNFQFSTELKYLSNDDKSRHFACILVEESYREIFQQLCVSIDETLKEFQLPPYYEDSIFHMSVLWKLNEFTDDEKQDISAGIADIISCNGSVQNFVDKITFKTGNKVKFLHSL